LYISPTFGAETKYCIIEFTDPENVKTAAVLTGTPLHNRPIQVSINAAAIPKGLVAAASDPSSPGSAGVTSPPVTIVSPTGGMLVAQHRIQSYE
jgi:hypothetical protein